MHPLSTEPPPPEPKIPNFIENINYLKIEIVKNSNNKFTPKHKSSISSSVSSWKET
jgi:hypothetical protein